jgi:hypothetical protein
VEREIEVAETESDDDEIAREEGEIESKEDELKSLFEVLVMPFSV